jgi:rare lipoprotein A
MLNLAARLTAGAYLLVVVVLMFGVAGGFAAECPGTYVVTSWYGAESGNRTANGERFDGSSFTAASRMLPFGTRLRVTYRGQSVLVIINDRGPYIKGRSLDLSRAAARRIGLIAAGVGRVCIEPVARAPP